MNVVRMWKTYGEKCGECGEKCDECGEKCGECCENVVRNMVNVVNLLNFPTIFRVFQQGSHSQSARP